MGVKLEASHPGDDSATVRATGAEYDYLDSLALAGGPKPNRSARDQWAIRVGPQGFRVSRAVLAELGIQ